MQLLRPTTEAESDDLAAAVESQDDDPGEGRGDAPSESPPTTKPTKGATKSQKKPKPKLVLKSRNLHLSDDIYKRLRQTALEKGSTASLVCNELLDRNLPKWLVTREG